MLKALVTVKIKDLVIPTTPVPRVEGLDVYVDGLMCNSEGCDSRFITRRVEPMQQHAREVHGWTNPKSKGRPVRGSSIELPWTTAVKCQQFFKRGPQSQYFEVTIQSQDGRVSQSALVHRAGTSEAAWKRRMEKDRKQARIMIEKAMKDEKDLVHKAAKGEINPWIERTGWARHLEGYRRRRLVPLIAKPDADAEPELHEIGRRFDKIVGIAQTTVTSRVNTFTRMEINRKDIQGTEKKPFNATLEEDTKKRYCNEFKGVIWYILRIWMRRGEEVSHSDSEDSESDGSASESETGSEQGDVEPRHFSGQQQQARRLPKKLPEYQMSAKQEQLTEYLVGKLREITVDGVEVEQVGADDDPEIQSGRLDHINRVILRWCVELFNDRIGGLGGDDFSSPVIAALAIVGIQSSGAWMSALSYTPKLSAVVKLVRIMVVHHAWEVAQEGREGTTDIFQQTRKMVEGFMTTHEPTPMKWIHDVRRYGLKIRMTTASAGTIRWFGERLHYQNKEFTRSEFQSMVHGLVDKARTALMEDVMLFVDEDEQRATLPRIPWNELHDNAAEDEPGWSFTDDRRNEWPVDGKTWLAERIWSDEVLRERFIRSDEDEQTEQVDHPWHTERVAMWLRFVVHFKELLLLLMHITGGGPARTPEILSIRYCNTAEGGRRNIFVESGLMVFVTQYHKGYALSGQPKVVYRYLPQEVGELLLWYIWLVLPLQQEFVMRTLNVKRIDAFLWSSKGEGDGQQWTGERMKRAMVRETGLGMGVELNIADYRQCAAAMTDKYLGKQDGFKGDTEEDSEGEEEERWWVSQDQPMHLQFAHSSHEAAVGYARDIEESGFSTVGMRLRWRLVSENWHRHLRFPSAMSSMAGGSSQRSGTVDRDWQDIEGRIAARRKKYMQEVDIHAELRRLVGPEARFRGVQEVTLQAIVGGKARILAIMGTGSGKSLTFMLPAAFKEAGTTIVIVPMISLRADMKRRCGEMHIQCVEWDSRRPAEKASIVLVTPESVPTKAFHGFLNRLRGMHRLERIVIDECHTILDSSDTFRPKLLALREVMSMGCQVLMLTATLPPREEEEFMKRMGIDGLEVARFRAKTTRANIGYERQDYDGSDEMAVAKIKELRQELEAGSGKMIVYVRGQRERVEKIAEKIGEPAFHSKIGEREKRRILKQFTTGKTRVVVATNASGMGVDIPDIRIVVHVDAPDSLRDYAQESGRAGRDGLTSQGIILSKPNVGEKEAQEQEDTNMFLRWSMRLPGRREMQAFVRGKGCRRLVMDRYLDGDEGRKRCEEEVACDVCQREQASVRVDAVEEMAINEEAARWEEEEISRRKQMARRERVGFEEEIGVMAEEWCQVCAICKVQGRSIQSSRHPTRDCRRCRDEQVQGEIKSTRDGFRAEDFAGCRSCGFPQGLCMKWVATAQGFVQVIGQKCQWRYVLIDVVVTLMMAGFREDGQELGSTGILRWMDENGVDLQDKGKVYGWYGKRVKVGEVETNILCRIFHRLVGRYQEGPGEFQGLD